MIKKFDEFNAKIKYITRVNTDAKVAEILDIPQSTYAKKKANNDIPLEKVLNYFKDKNVDLNWLFKVKNEADKANKAN
ncbi:MAG: hypothetical protein ACI81I_000084 [Arcobacteraceae bacterium]|jgi:hypothetical protein